MNRSIQLSLAIILSIAIGHSDAFARGFGGFHGGSFHAGGYGGYHAGGYGGYHAGGYGGYHAGAYGGYHEGSYGGYRAGGYAAGSYAAGGYHAAGYAGGVMDRSQLTSFLGLPTDGGMAAAGRAGVAGNVYQGPGGTTVAHGVAGAQGIAAGPEGFAAGGRVASGTAIKTPNGNVYTHTDTAARGIAAGPNGVVAGRGFASSASATGAMGHYSATSMHAQGMACQHWFAGSAVYSSAWCGAHPWAWHPAAYTATAWSTAAWRVAGWATLGALVASDASPAYYDYGDNVTYQGDEVYYGSQPYVTQQQYYQQAANLAGSSGGNANSDSNTQWVPLGVFGLMASGQKTPQMIFQLAVDSAGTIRGNYYDQIADTNVPVHGQVDKKDQRAAWQVGANKTLVIETGIYNLTQDQSTALVHYGPDDTVQFVLVRIKQPSAAQPNQNDIPPGGGSS